MPRAIKNIWPFDSFQKTTIHRSSGVTTSTSSRSRYKGHIIHKRGDGTFDIPDIDSETVFDTLKDAKRFVDYSMKHGYANPAGRVADKEFWFQKGIQQGFASSVSARESFNNMYSEHNKNAHWEDFKRGFAHGRDELDKRYGKQNLPNPKRVIVNIKNPADWFQRCVEGVESKGGAYDPQAVCAGVMRRKKARGNPDISPPPKFVIRKDTSTGYYEIFDENGIHYGGGYPNKSTATAGARRIYAKLYRIYERGKKSRNPVGAGLLDISPYYTAQLVDSASRGIQRGMRISNRRNPGIRQDRNGKWWVTAHGNTNYYGPFDTKK